MQRKQIEKQYGIQSYKNKQIDLKKSREIHYKL